MPQLPFDPPDDRPGDAGTPAPDPFGTPRLVVPTRRTAPVGAPPPRIGTLTMPLVALLCAGLALIAVPVTLAVIGGIDLRVFVALATAGLLDVIAVVLALLVWRRPGRPRRHRALALAGGVLGGCSLIGWAVLGAVCWQQVDAQRDRNLARAQDCVAGSDLAACDQLYVAAQTTADQRRTAETCGGRGDDIRPDHTCAQMTVGPQGTLVVADNGDLEPRAYGEDDELDALWDACGTGDSAACDTLYLTSPLGSEYETFGRTCADRRPSRMATCVESEAPVG